MSSNETLLNNSPRNRTASVWEESSLQKWLQFGTRHIEDVHYRKKDYDVVKYVRKRQREDFPSREPSFRKFHVPYSITCAQRYKDCIKKYEDQIMHEINQYVDFHSKACDAAFLVRCMAITSLWPPLYSRQDLTNTSNYFFALKPKEKIRLHVLMNTDII